MIYIMNGKLYIKIGTYS